MPSIIGGVAESSHALPGGGGEAGGGVVVWKKNPDAKSLFPLGVFSQSNLSCTY